jgi:hypothetical protein
MPSGRLNVNHIFMGCVIANAIWSSFLGWDLIEVAMFEHLVDFGELFD